MTVIYSTSKAYVDSQAICEEISARDFNRVSIAIDHLTESVVSQRFSEALACLASVDTLLGKPGYQGVWKTLEVDFKDSCEMIVQALNQNWLDEYSGINSEATDSAGKGKELFALLNCMPTRIKSEILIAPLVEMSSRQPVSDLIQHAMRLQAIIEPEFSSSDFIHIKQHLLTNPLLRKRCIELAFVGLECGEVGSFLEYRASLWFAGHSVLPAALQKACLAGVEVTLQRMLLAREGEELDDCLKEVGSLAALGSLDQVEIWHKVTNQALSTASISERHLRLITSIFFPFSSSNESIEIYIEQLSDCLEMTDARFYPAIAGILHAAAFDGAIPLSHYDVEDLDLGDAQIPKQMLDPEISISFLERELEDAATPCDIYEDRIELVPSLATSLGRRVYRAYADLMGVTTQISIEQSGTSTVLSGEYVEESGDIRFIQISPEVWRCPWDFNPMVAIVFDHEYGHAELQYELLGLAATKVDGYCDGYSESGERQSFAVDELYQHRTSIERAREFRNRFPSSEHLLTCWIEQAEDTHRLLEYYQALVRVVATVEYSEESAIELKEIDRLPTYRFQAFDEFGRSLELSPVFPEVLFLDWRADAAAVENLSQQWWSNTRQLLSDTLTFLRGSCKELAEFVGLEIANIIVAPEPNGLDLLEQIAKFRLHFGFLQKTGVLATVEAVKDFPDSNNGSVAICLAKLIDDARETNSDCEQFLTDVWEGLFGFRSLP